MNSSVYTKPWVVEFMLDLVGYVPGTGISGKTIVEPSCGEGSFLGSIACRLAREVQTQRLEWLSIENAVIACDISSQAVQKSAQVVQRTLQCYGCPPLLACKIADSWVQQGDFLTASLRKCSYVVGNPPYIRACEIDASVRDVYLKALPSFTRGCDLYVGFFDKGLDILENDGVLCYICADRWLQNSYGNRLRKKIGSGFDLDLLIRMHNIDAFEDSVMAYPAITLIQNRKNVSGKFCFADCKKRLSSDDALKIRTHEGTENFEICELPAPLAGDVYPLGDSNQISRISSIRETLPKIEDAGIRIGIGITTGCDSVFITDNHDIVEDSRLVPLFLMREYRKNRPMRKWLINPWDNSGNLVDLESFPLLKDYLYAHHERLMSRHVARKNASSWYRTIDRINYSLLGKELLLVPDLAATPDPVLSKGYYPHHNCYWLSSDTWDMRALGGILMSDITREFIGALGVKMRGGTLRFQAQYLRLLHIPELKTIRRDVLEGLSSAFSARDRKRATYYANIAYQEAMNNAK